MGDADQNRTAIQPDWLLANVPFVSFICENDAFYSMRFLTFGGGAAFGYNVDDFIDNKHYFAASTTHPEDADIVDAHAEQAVGGGAPVVSRYRLVQADGMPVPVLLVSKAVRGASGSIEALAGVCVDLRRVPALQGPPGLLSQLRVPTRQRPVTQRPREIDTAWAANELPVTSFFVENDEHFTVRKSCGSVEELLGYSAEDFANARKYKPASATLPADVDIADAYIELASSQEGAQVAARLRLVNSDGESVPVIVFARGARPPGAEIGVAGGVLDIRHIPALQGPFGVLGE